jgi:hypothetical protein
MIKDNKTSDGKDYIINEFNVISHIGYDAHIIEIE